MKIQVDANGRPLFFLHYFPTPALFLQWVQLSAHQLTLSGVLDRPCSKFELESRGLPLSRNATVRSPKNRAILREREKKKQTEKTDCSSTAEKGWGRRR